MASRDPVRVESVSDTALWVAHLRALESERADALFRDPFARLLSGDRGERLAGVLGTRVPKWSLTIRTVLLDGLVRQAVERDGVDTVLNLAAGLDTRPYRLPLPSALRWIEVDLPAMIDFKTHRLAAERPICRLEHAAVDLNDAPTRDAFFDRIDAEARKTLIITEGLLTYLTDAQVKSLATGLRGRSSFNWWIANYSGRLARDWARRNWGKKLPDQYQHIYFAVDDGPAFFGPLGWKEAEYHSFMDAGQRLGRDFPWARVWRPWLPLAPRDVQEAIRRVQNLVVMTPQ